MISAISPGANLNCAKLFNIQPIYMHSFLCSFNNFWRIYNNFSFILFIKKVLYQKLYFLGDDHDAVFLRRIVVYSANTVVNIRI